MTIALLVILRNMEIGKFSRYEIGEELGEGGMAKVYRAKDPLSGREVALKILRQELSQDPEFRERFDLEMRIVARLEFDGIVPVYDFGRDEKDQLFFVMRLMPGGTLSEKIQHGLLSPDQIIQIVQRIAPVLDRAHRRGIIHRDLKPRNILFDETNNAFLSDFGVAKAVDPNTLTNSGVIVGTPRYMSPEQANGERVDARSDIYSLGVIAFEMFIGTTQLETITPWGLALDRETDLIPRLLDTNPDLAPAVREVMEKVLAKDRDSRYGSGVEFANALTVALSEPEITPQLVSPEPITAPPEPMGPEPAVQTRPAIHRTSSSLRFWMIGGFAVLALFTFGLVRIFNPPSPLPTSTSTPRPATATVAPSSPTTLSTILPTISPSPTIEPSPTLSVPIIGGAINIAFVSNREVFMIDIDGRNRKQLTNTNIPKFDLQWLPDSSELLYGEGKCIYKVNSDADLPVPEKISCLTDDDFVGFSVSPDGANIAISVKDRLLILPFDLELLATANSADELQKSENICIDYSDVTVKDAQWSTDGKSLAVLYRGPVGNNSKRFGDTILMLDVDLVHCDAFDPVVLDKFPDEHFIPAGYAAHPIIPSYHWDGDEHFAFNTYVRNDRYGDLYLYDISTGQGQRFNPVKGTCCYQGATFSPDGSYILFAFQDINAGSEGRIKLYYIPLDGNQEILPLILPVGFFTNSRENILLSLRAP